jgi:uncharacterized protein involved in exopolysaccharide biosynthesis
MSATPARDRIEAPESGLHGASILDALVTLAGHLHLLVVVPLAAGLLALALSFLVKPSFTATAQMLVPQDQGGSAAAMLGSLGGLAGAVVGGGGSGLAAGLKNPADQWVSMLKSRTVADALIARFKLKELYQADYQFEARDELANNSRISAGKDGMIDIEFDDHSPERAASVANAYIDELRNLSKGLALTEASQRRLFLEGQLAKAKDSLTKAETLLSDVGVNPDVMKASPEATFSELGGVKALVEAQSVKLSVLRGVMADTSPEVQQARLELSALREQLARIEHRTPAATAGPATKASDASGRYIERYRNFKYYETLYETIAKQYELARSDEAKEGAMVQVVDPALVPEWKSKPKRALIAVFTTLLVFLLCVIFIFVRRVFAEYGRDPVSAAKVDAIRRRLPGRRGRGPTVA